MTTKETITETAKLFKPDHTAVIFCADPKLPQMLYWELTNPMENTKWCTVIPTAETDIIREMESWKQDHETEWFLLDLERISSHYAQLSKIEKFAQLLLAVDDFAKKHHLKMLVSFAFSDKENSLITAQMLDSYLKQNQRNVSVMLMTDKDPITLTIATDENNCATIGYELYNNGKSLKEIQ